MTEHTLLLIEVAGIQDYVFGSNQLAQNLGASELVTLASEDWVYDQLDGLHLRHNVDRTRDPPLTEHSVARDGLDAEVIYAAGGNALLRFAGDRLAESFAQKLTLHVLQHAPELQLVVQRVSYDPDGVVLARLQREELRSKLWQRKFSRPLSVPLLGLGVTAECVYTGAPAVALHPDDDRLPISAEVQAKLGAEAAARRRLGELLPQVEQNGFQFAYNWNELGEKGESSFLAVVHTDGNRMGERLQKLADRYPTRERNEDYLQALRRWSFSVEHAADKGLQTVAGMLLDGANWFADPDDPQGPKKLGGQVPQGHKPDGSPVLPFRPLVYGGDDVTFVCEGRLGLALAAAYLQTCCRQVLEDGEPFHTRGGVAVVKTHYPFSRAYQLADDLCRSAKAYIREQPGGGSAGVTAFDWHFAVSGLVLRLEKVRLRDYKVGAGRLHMRPLRLSDAQGDWRSWQTFVALMAELQTPEDEGGKWAGRRNKVKALREALREGPAAVRLFLQGEELPDIPAWPELKREGWHGDRCGYWDAIEALDFYVPLKGAEAA